MANYTSNEVDVSHCEHLHNYSGNLYACSCRRYLRVYDPRADNYATLNLCNEWLRLKVQEGIHQGHEWSIAPRYVASDIIEKLVFDHLEIKTHKRPYNDFSINYVNMYFCERPYISGYVSMKDAIEWCLANHRSDVFWSVHNQVTRWCERNERFKKHKSNCATIKLLLNKLKHLYRPEDKEPIINELFLIILKIQTNETH